jgi:hypothetical protein
VLTLVYLTWAYLVAAWDDGVLSSRLLCAGAAWTYWAHLEAVRCCT